MGRYASFETERLILKPTDLADAEFVFEQTNTAKWLANIGDRNIHSIEDAENYIKAQHISQFDRLGYGNYTIIRKHDQQRVGSCGLYDREGLKGIDIGFALLPAYERKGYAYEASLRLKEVAIEEFGLRSIGAITTKANLASQSLLTKLGLEFVEFRKIPGDDEELMYYQLLVD